MHAAVCTTSGLHPQGLHFTMAGPLLSARDETARSMPSHEVIFLEQRVQAKGV